MGQQPKNWHSLHGCLLQSQFTRSTSKWLKSLRSIQRCMVLSQKFYRGFMTMGGKFYYYLLNLLFVFWTSILWRQTYWVTRPLKTLQPQVLMLPFRNSKTIMENLVTLRRKRLSYSHYAGEISSIFAELVMWMSVFNWVAYYILPFTIIFPSEG